MIKYFEASLNQGELSLTLREKETRKPKLDEILINTKYLFLEHIDYKLITHGIFKRSKLELPLTPGIIATGTLASSNQTLLAHLPYNEPGTYAEQIICKKQYTYPIEAEQQVKAGSNYVYALTAHQLFNSMLKRRPTNMLITDIGSGVGQYLAQYAYSLGCKLFIKKHDELKDNLPLLRLITDFIDLDNTTKHSNTIDTVIDTGSDFITKPSLQKVLKSGAQIITLENRLDLKENFIKNHFSFSHFIVREYSQKKKIESLFKTLLKSNFTTRESEFIHFEEIPKAITIKRKHTGWHFIVDMEKKDFYFT